MSVTFPFRNGRRALSGIYKITSPSGRVYVGQSWNIQSRWNSYRRYLCRSQPRLYRSLRKYGADNHRFEIVAWFSAGCNQATLDWRERELIASLKSEGVQMLNVFEGGRGSEHTAESKRKIGAANRGNKRPDLAAYNRRFKSAQMTGSKHSQETKDKIALAHKGKAWAKGRVQSVAERQKRSEITRQWWADKKAAEGVA